MKRIAYLALVIVIENNSLSAQSIKLPWQVIDNGGRQSISGGILMQGSVGQAAVAAMASGGTLLESGYIPGLRYLSGTTATLDVAAEAGWNMISVPFAVSDSRKSVLYPAGTSNAFSYQGSYVIKDTLNNATGYWVKFSGAGITHLTGGILVSDTIHVVDKWNMIGCLSYPMLLSGIVPLDSTTTVSKYWGYASGSGYYTEDTLKPGKAYWIKVHNAGRMALKTGSVMMQPAASAKAREQRNTESQSDVNMLTFTDVAGSKRTLYVASATTTTDTSAWEMPPPHDGVMDVRFGTNRMLESADPSRGKDLRIDISSAEYPLTLSWNVKDQPVGMKLIIGHKTIELKSTGEAQIPNSNSQTRLLLSASSGSELPKQFALYQNYPNPFNPTTTVRYDLPLRSHVRLMVYDALGREVNELINGEQDAGYQSIEWNSTNRNGNAVASGMYFYRIEARSLADPGKTFMQVNKMLLIK